MPAPFQRRAPHSAMPCPPARPPSRAPTPDARPQRDPALHHAAGGRRRGLAVWQAPLAPRAGGAGPDGGRRRAGGAHRPDLQRARLRLDRRLRGGHRRLPAAHQEAAGQHGRVGPGKGGRELPARLPLRCWRSAVRWMAPAGVGRAAVEPPARARAQPAGTCPPRHPHHVLPVPYHTVPPRRHVPEHAAAVQQPAGPAPHGRLDAGRHQRAGRGAPAGAAGAAFFMCSSVCLYVAVCLLALRVLLVRAPDVAQARAPVLLHLHACCLPLCPSSKRAAGAPCMANLAYCAPLRSPSLASPRQVGAYPLLCFPLCFAWPTPVAPPLPLPLPSLARWAATRACATPALPSSSSPPAPRPSCSTSASSGTPPAPVALPLSGRRRLPVAGPAARPPRGATARGAAAARPPTPLSTPPHRAPRPPGAGARSSTRRWPPM